MRTVEEIMTAIERLPFEGRAELARRLHGWTNDEWDRQMVDDVLAGRFDCLVAEVDQDIEARRLHEMP